MDTKILKLQNYRPNKVLKPPTAQKKKRIRFCNALYLQTLLNNSEFWTIDILMN